MSDKSVEEKGSLLDFLKKIWLPVAGFLTAVRLTYDFYKAWESDRNTLTLFLAGAIYVLILLTLAWVGFGRKHGNVPDASSQPRFRLPYRLSAWAGIALLLYLGFSVYAGFSDANGYNHFYAGDYNQAIASFDRAIRLHPDDAALYFYRGVSYYYLGDQQRAIEDYDRSLQINPQDAQTYYFRGTAYFDLGDTERAIQEYDQALEIGPDYVDAYYFRGLAHVQLNDYQNALRDYDQVLRLNPQYKEIYVERGLVYTYLYELERALQDFNQALQIDPQYADAYFHRGETYFELGSFQSAILNFSQAIQVNPEYTAAYISRGAAYSVVGQYANAIDDYELALSWDPDDAGLLNNTAYLMAQHDIRLPDALGYVNRALALEPDNPYYLDTQGYIYYKTGDYEKALNVFTYIIQEKQFTLSYYGRGLVYEALGDSANAIADLKEFVALHPDEASAGDVMQHLEALGAAP